MALHLIIGFRGNSSDSAFDVIYSGTNGDEMEKAVAGLPFGKYARALSVDVRRGIPVRLPTKPTVAPAPAKATETKHEEIPKKSKQ